MSGAHLYEDQGVLERDLFIIEKIIWQDKLAKRKTLVIREVR